MTDQKIVNNKPIIEKSEKKTKAEPIPVNRIMQPKIYPITCNTLPIYLLKNCIDFIFIDRCTY